MPAVQSLARPRSEASRLLAGGFLAAAVVVAGVRIATPITRGWWLVSFLALVGGVSQLLLADGLAVLARRGGPPDREPVAWRARLVLWNAGTVAVAVGDLAGSPAGVLAGSAALLAALALFARGLRLTVTGVPGGSAPAAWTRAYVLLLVLLAVSVATGAGLAGALPPP